MDAILAMVEEVFSNSFSLPPSIQTYAKQQAKVASQLLEEYYLQKQQQQQFEKIRYCLFEELGTIVQASSLVETFNSILKPFINSARGQLNQPLLNLVAFYHNPLSMSATFIVLINLSFFYMINKGVGKI